MRAMRQAFPHRRTHPFGTIVRRWQLRSFQRETCLDSLNGSIEAVLGFRLDRGTMVPPGDLATADGLAVVRLARDVSRSPLDGPASLRPPAQSVEAEPATR